MLCYVCCVYYSGLVENAQQQIYGLGLASTCWGAQQVQGGKAALEGMELPS